MVTFERPVILVHGAYLRTIEPSCCCRLAVKHAHKTKITMIGKRKYKIGRHPHMPGTFALNIEPKFQFRAHAVEYLHACSDSHDQKSWNGNGDTLGPT
jgi:hypothetical protein